MRNYPTIIYEFCCFKTTDSFQKQKLNQKAKTRKSNYQRVKSSSVNNLNDMSSEFLMRHPLLMLDFECQKVYIQALTFAVSVVC